MPPREQPCAHTSIITMLFPALWHLTTAADMTVRPAQTYIRGQMHLRAQVPAISTYAPSTLKGTMNIIWYFGDTTFPIKAKLDACSGCGV